MHETDARQMRVTLAFVAAIVTATAGCTPTGSEAAERRQDTAGRRDSIAAVSAASMSQDQVLGLLAASNAADSAIGALGAMHGSSPDVKEFGRMIQREHHALRAEVADLGRQLGIAVAPPSVPPDEAPAAAEEALRGAQQGPVWDRAYVEYSMTAHQAAFENAARALAAARGAEIRQFIARSVPILQKHLDKAQRLQRQLATSRPDTAGKGRVPSAAAKGAPLR